MFDMRLGTTIYEPWYSTALDNDPPLNHLNYQTLVAQIFQLHLDLLYEPRYSRLKLNRHTFHYLSKDYTPVNNDLPKYHDSKEHRQPTHFHLSVVP